MSQTATPQSISICKAWWIAARPFSFPASVMPVMFGAVAAVAVGGASFHPAVFVASILGIVILHAASNMLNDVYDYSLGLDKQVFPVSGAVVRELLSPKAVHVAAGILYFLGGLLGLWVAWQTTFHILWIGFLGVAVGIGYSYSSIGLKYLGLGDLCVFLSFGILATLGSWTAQTGSPSWIPVLWAVPFGLLIIAIVHSNNWRDIAGDLSQGACSVASRLGDKGSLVYYGCVLFVPFLLICLFTFVPRVVRAGPAMPLGALVSLCSLPMAYHLYRKGLHRESQHHEFVGLDGKTAQFNLLFGGLVVLGFFVTILIS